MIVNVNFFDKNVGLLMWDTEKGVALFQYNKEFLRSNIDIAPVMMSLNKSGENRVYQFLGNRNGCFCGLPGLIADSLPDKFGTEIINAWFSSKGMPVDYISPLDRLCYIGKRGMGALEFEPNRTIKGLDSSSKIRIDMLTSLSDAVFRDRANFMDLLIQEDRTILDILKIGTSAGGAKPKAIIAYNDITKEVRSGQVKAPDGFTYWLLKFDGTTYSEHGNISNNPRGIGNIEYAYYRMALDSGIQMMESRLLTEGDFCHFMTKRFDRTDSGEKIHVQSLAGIAHLDRDIPHSYEEAFSIMRKMNLPYGQQEEFFRRMVFNVVARNHDDHTKNHSFLMDKEGKWSLAPAYDLCYAYSPGGRWTQVHQMSINGKRDEFTFNDLEKTGQAMGINHPQLIIESVVDVVSQWRTYAKESGVKYDHMKQIENNLILPSQKKI